MANFSFACMDKSLLPRIWRECKYVASLFFLQSWCSNTRLYAIKEVNIVGSLLNLQERELKKHFQNIFKVRKYNCIIVELQNIYSAKWFNGQHTQGFKQPVLTLTQANATQRAYSDRAGVQNNILTVKTQPSIRVL